ncbi:MAG: hypothetical protein P4L98_02090 [Ancalomicrobiaceae bacterium]|nr:hypothetical protein [Ancalomicrobiaceae bacterium]
MGVVKAIGRHPSLPRATTGGQASQARCRSLATKLTASHNRPLSDV